MFDKRIVTKDQKNQLVSLLGSDNVNAVRAETKFKVIQNLLRENYDIDGMSKQEAVDCIVHGFRTVSPVEELINDINEKIREAKSAANNSITEKNRDLCIGEADGLTIALTMIIGRKKELEGK